MWNRKDLKMIGKQSFSRNFWKCVLVALIISGLIGGSSGAMGGSVGGMSSAIAGIKNGSSGTTEFSAPQNDSEIPFDFETGEPDFSQIPGSSSGLSQTQILAIVGVIVVFVLIIVIIATVISIFLYLPLEVGCRRFYLNNLKENAEVKEVAYGYDHAYKNNVLTLFLRNLFVFLWSLLFIIPGIIKSYEYRMIPYILAENPGISRQEAFAHSKMLMKGNKWHTFVLDLSFLGWWILSAFTAGILAIFYVSPYYNATCAALYDALEHGGRSNPMPGMADGTSMFTGMPPQQM